MYSDSSPFFHQAPQVEKESGAEGEEDVGDSQNHFEHNGLIITFKRMYNSFLFTFMETTFFDVEICYSENLLKCCLL